MLSPLRLLRLFCAVTLLTTTILVAEEPLPELDQLELAGNQALQRDDREAVRKVTKKITASFSENADAMHFCGEIQYRVGLVELAVESFDKVVELEPRRMPYLWQRGLALYDAGKFEAGRLQFESHRLVNPHDVENATWHYLCVAAIEGEKKARELLLPAPGDARVPMKEVYELYAGRMTVADVMAAAEAIPAGTASGRASRFYGELYVGLWHQVAGRLDEAKAALQRSLDTGMKGYMADSAKVRLQRLSQTKKDE